MGRPIKKLSLGNVRLAIWENDFKGNKSYNYTPEKNYVDKKTNEWKTTNNFSGTDLDCLDRLIQMVRLKNVKELLPKPPKEEPKMDEGLPVNDEPDFEQPF